MTPDDGRWLTVAQAAARLAESERTVRRLIGARRLTSRRAGLAGRKLLVEAASVAALIRATTTEAAPGPRPGGRTPSEAGLSEAEARCWGPSVPGGTRARRGATTR